MRILAIADDDATLDLIRVIATEFEVLDVSAWKDASCALEDLAKRADPFDCLIFDLNMPDMSGSAFCTEVRQLDRYRLVPIIMLAGAAEQEDLETAFHAGATDFVLKPVSGWLLGAKLRFAQKLLAARTVPSGEIADELTVLAGRTSRSLHLVRPVLTDGMENVVELSALRQALMSITSSGLSAMQIVAVRIDQIEQISARATDSEFIHVVSEVADTLNFRLGRQGNLIAYAGQGTFVVSSSEAAAMDSSETEREVQYLLDEKDILYDNGLEVIVEISVGAPVRPSFSDLAGAPKAIFKAIERAEQRSRTKKKGPVSAFRKFDV